MTVVKRHAQITPNVETRHAVDRPEQIHPVLYPIDTQGDSAPRVYPQGPGCPLFLSIKFEGRAMTIPYK
ncbi:hypothetical protein AGABI2DRAFT_193607 [Agaricus bisporus var. bisporus H97]|uniref:hypothetical protein n=1 Tax=Agaricus bisporus var. bisporus (strain H97 / ATCC MYA-4626 / FGSC 10389) TaxID=936046 RepID=UPI00029F7E8A|nr:hypothetical protein AGABI2DRAFT_193607 [Agaricus bisporus var. bisporus H97]EKV45649.1 hypothetical protein AGABI2DRAFT_193607 [Agaricus bisporus var. bisporus H97]